MGVAVVLLANDFLGGGKCPNLGVVNVRILGEVNVLLANDSQSVQGGFLWVFMVPGWSVIGLLWPSDDDG